MVCLAKMGYQPQYHAMYIASEWFSAKFCLAHKFAKQNFLLNSFMKLSPAHKATCIRDFPHGAGLNNPMPLSPPDIARLSEWLL